MAVDLSNLGALPIGGGAAKPSYERKSYPRTTVMSLVGGSLGAASVGMANRLNKMPVGFRE